MTVKSKAKPKPKRAAAMSKAEREARIKLAAAFRIAHRLGWNDGVNNHITMRVPDDHGCFLMNKRALGWDEITASNLTKLDFVGTIADDPANPVGRAGLNFHTAILEAKPEINCVLHVHPKAGVVVSATDEGLKILDQNGCALLGKLAYHAFEGYASEHDEGERIVRELGNNYAMIMWNHGLLTVGRDVSEAFGYMRRLIDACETQERLYAMGVKIRPIPDQVLEQMKVQMAERRGNQLFGGYEWDMFFRQAKRLDPSFMA
jgi:ribulose-5-phosphate 4-epimerase/fuculose-1-phosphate aldolase